MYQNTSKQWLRMAAAIIIAAVALNPSASYADDPPCSLIPGIGDGQCGCIEGHVVICSSGYLWIPGRGECEGYTCGGSTAPKILGNRKTKPGGVSKGETVEVKDPISTGGGEFREYWKLLSLGGGFLPLDFTLGYMPDIDFSTPASDGPAQFPPSDAVKAFTSNTVMRLVEFTDQSITPNTDYVNILMFDDLLVFKYDSGTAKFLPVGPVKYQLEKKSSGYYYLMNPDNDLVYIFRSRELDYAVTSPAHQIRRVGEIEYVLDRNGSRISYTYNSDYLPTLAEENGTGRKLTLTYSGGGLSSAADGAGRTVSFVYQSLTCGGTAATTLTGFKDAMNQQTAFEYDTSTSPCYLIKKIRRPLGNSNIDQTWTSNPKGVKGISSQKDAYGNETKLSWSQDASGNLITTVSNPDGTQQTFHHEAERYPLDMKDAAGKSRGMSYTADNQISQITDRMGDKTSMTYHAASGRLASVTDAENQTVTYTYAAQSQTFTNPANSEAVVFTFYNLTQIAYPDETEEQFSYDSRGNVLTRTDRNGKAWEYTYNAKGQVLTEKNPAGGVTTREYNADGTLASQTDSDTGKTAYQYDAYKRIVQISYPDSSVYKIAYDANDLITQITDRKGTVTAFEYDGNRNLTGSRQAVGTPSERSAAYQYDLMDRMIRFTDPAGKAVQYEYSYWGAVRQITYPGNAQVKFAYDDRNWLIQFTDEAGKIFSASRDDEAVFTGFNSPGKRKITLGSDKLGNFSQVTDPGGNLYKIERDAMEQIVKVIDPLNREMSIARDGEGRITSMTLPVIGTVT